MNGFYSGIVTNEEDALLSTDAIHNSNYLPKYATSMNTRLYNLNSQIHIDGDELYNPKQMQSAGISNATKSPKLSSSKAGNCIPVTSNTGDSIPETAIPKRHGSFTNVFSKLMDGMPTGAMFAKLKNANAPANSQSIADTNPIRQYFDIGKQVACAGPELVWKIHDACRKSDGKVCSHFKPLKQKI